MKRVVVLALFVAIAEAKKAVIYIPPHFWTHITTYNCKPVSASLMRCTADIAYAGYSVTKPEQNTERLPLSKIEAK